MIVEPDFLHHWKTIRLVTLTGDNAAPLMVLRLWAHCQTRKAWKFVLKDEALAAICGWQKPASELRGILLECGFIDSDPKLLIVHDWNKSNRYLISAWRNGVKGGRPTITDRIPTGNQPANPRQTGPSYLSSLSYPSDSDDEFKALFEKWVDFRVGLGKKPRDWGALFQEQLTWLAGKPKTQRTEIISQSIRNGWQGLFEPKNNGSNEHQPRKRETRMV